MGRLLAIDYGRKRCGIAATDTSRIVATGVATIATSSLTEFLKGYFSREQVDLVVVGEPRDMHGDPSESMKYIKPAVARLCRDFPEMKFVYFDERFTSTLAHRAMIDGGMRKSRRRVKGEADVMAATIILNDFLESQAYQLTQSI
ncbi:MAG: Holliday junction resolvase RuvX [Muribaculaceae bacterium]|nr:Holliday junction resolvase RuvX [Muribaculaceae bacterium]MDE5935686.1 Holliday junction resolvase RuvX [Muribaculaceae bacterium]MDE6344547.1 Holliday junction resolvase RuvX [Muribaculaceae bacterium]MDE6504114.1 Holliday junction resolvase RuvX [Muribaculaceae bacterium]MDE6609171.1 Holliday junction resolvase RuvX [Muribaculaceae bacterium]